MATEKRRLIDANAIPYEECFVPNGDEQFSYSKELCVIKPVIDQMPTVDAVEVVHGEWIVLAEFFDGSICTRCSACGEEYTYKKGRFEHINTEYAKYNYCPNCGAKMDGGNEDG